MSIDQIYGDLPARSIRVLDIHAGDNSSQLQGSLRTIELDNSSSDFAALSYVWGGIGPDPAWILCNDAFMKVTDNCHAALLHLRRKLGAYTIWVDAICINQQNAEEKTAQVQLMGEVYSKATQTYIWLGPASDTSDKVIRYLSTTSLRHFMSSGCENTAFGVLKADLWLLCSLAGFGAHALPYGYRPALWPECMWILPRDHVSCAELVMFLDDQWLRRVWTYQEVLLASRPVLVCGCSHITWPDFAAAILMLARLNNPSSTDLAKYTRSWEAIVLEKERMLSTDLTDVERFTIRVMDSLAIQMVVLVSIVPTFLWCVIITGIVLAAKRVEHRTMNQTGWILIGIGSPLWVALLYGLLQAIRKCYPVLRPRRRPHADALPFALYGRVATNPEDMAYGAWAILRSRGAILSEPRSDRSLQDIYQELTYNILLTTGSTAFVVLASFQGLSGCPSWIPDWAATTTWSQVLRPDNDHLTNKEIVDMTYSGVSKILHEERKDTKCSVSNGVLTVQACVVGKIKAAALFLKSSDIPTEQRESIYHSNMRMLTECLTWPFVDTQELFSIASVYVDNKMWLAWSKQLRKGIKWNTASEAFRQWHIDACEKLANADRKICRVELVGQDHVGASRQAKSGDRIIRIKGQAELLVVRAIDESNMDNVKIVGPYLNVSTGPFGSFPWTPNYFNDNLQLHLWTTPNGFSEFQIH